jgi:hypothetical protein
LAIRQHQVHVPKAIVQYVVLQVFAPCNGIDKEQPNNHPLARCQRNIPKRTSRLASDDIKVTVLQGCVKDCRSLGLQNNAADAVLTITIMQHSHG